MIVWLISRGFPSFQITSARGRGTGRPRSCWGSLDPGASLGDCGPHRRPASGDANANGGLSPSTTDVVRFLRVLLRKLPGKLLIISDGTRSSIAASRLKTFWPVGPPSVSISSNCLAMRLISIQ